MPCTYDETPEESLRNGGGTSGHLGAILCGIVRVLDRENYLSKILDAVDWAEVGVTRHQFDEWWSVHQRRDVERRRREAEEQRKSRLVADAIAKLTPEELFAMRGYGRS